MLEIRDLSVVFDGSPAVDHVDLALPDGEVLAVLGPSGCGKSTLLRAVAGLETPSGGRVCWDGHDLGRVPTHRRGFALMFQDGQLFDHMTVGRNVGYALRVRGAREAPARVRELLALVGLEGYADRLPRTLSGGERQRVALARSLAVQPRLLLLDEPLSALDAGLRERLAGELREILKAAGTTALMVTHDHEEAFTVADRLAVMRAGRVVQTGPIDEVWRAPADPDTALFLGYARVLEGEAARLLLATAGRPVPQAGSSPTASVAVRRSALVARAETTDGPLRGSAGGPLRGRVISARATPEQVRLVVRVPGLGEVDAVAALDLHPGAGDDVRLALDVTKVAVIPGGSTSGSATGTGALLD